VGAHALAERGVRMVAFVGGNEFFFDDMDVSERRRSTRPEIPD
jgi:hypothetical protein